MVFCVYMHENHCREIGSVVCGDGPARSSGQSLAQLMLLGFCGEVLNNSQERKEDRMDD